MNWEAIAAIGQILGSIAVFVTLGYLAVQIRQNTGAIRHSTYRGVFEDANEWRYRIIESPEVAELYRTGLRAPGDLTPINRFRFRMMLDVLFGHWQHAFRFDEKSTINTVHIPRLLAQPGGAEYWSSVTGPDWEVFDRDFVEFIKSSGGQKRRAQLASSPPRRSRMRRSGLAVQWWQIVIMVGPSDSLSQSTQEGMQ